MTREQLLYNICPQHSINICDKITCHDCYELLNCYLDSYDKHVIEQYEANRGLADTIRDIHDNVAQEMYCKGVDDMCKAINVYSAYDEYDNVVDVLEIAEQLKAGGKNE